MSVSALDLTILRVDLPSVTTAEVVRTPLPIATGRLFMPKPAAHGEPWDNAADKALSDAWATDADLTTIAEERGRSVGAILHRVVRLGLAHDLEEAKAAKSR